MEAKSRSERCAACGRPTEAGEDFGGPCVEDSDLACALKERDTLRNQLFVVSQRESQTLAERDDAIQRAERSEAEASASSAKWQRTKDNVFELWIKSYEFERSFRSIVASIDGDDGEKQVEESVNTTLMRAICVVHALKRAARTKE